MARDIHIPGKDFCDMSKPFDTPFEDYSIINCMLPTKYHPPLQGNIFERLAGKACAQLFGCTVEEGSTTVTFVKDYDQLLNKRPNKGDAVFGWHQGWLLVKESETRMFFIGFLALTTLFSFLYFRHGILAPEDPHARHAHRHFFACHRFNDLQERVHEVRSWLGQSTSHPTT
jgi:hypothetical protein